MKLWCEKAMTRFDDAGCSQKLTFWGQPKRDSKQYAVTLRVKKMPIPIRAQNLTPCISRQRLSHFRLALDPFATNKKCQWRTSQKTTCLSSTNKAASLWKRFRRNLCTSIIALPVWIAVAFLSVGRFPKLCKQVEKKRDRAYVWNCAHAAFPTKCFQFCCLRGQYTFLRGHNSFGTQSW